MISPLMDVEEIDEAFEAFKQCVTDGGQQVECTVGFQGGSETAVLTWHSEKDLWVLLQPERLENRYWCAFGTSSPEENTTVPITCEINPPRSGVNRQAAGLFVIDSMGAVHLAHSGKIGGGRAGVGKTAFMSTRNKNDVVPVRFPDGKDSDYVVVGRVDDDDFLADLAKFVHAVADFKTEAVAAKK